jgi:AhpD family alkylhydroperoxidase
MYPENYPLLCAELRGVVMGKQLSEFNAFRTRLNERILTEDHAVIKRFFGVDTLTYREGCLSARDKEMLGLVSSMVLRCDDCVRYHLIQCRKEGVTRGQFFDIFSVALTVGGSIVIPHLRRAVDFLDELESDDRDQLA